VFGSGGGAVDAAPDLGGFRYTLFCSPWCYNILLLPLLLFITIHYKSRDSLVSIMSDYGLDRGSIPDKRQRIFPLAFVSRPALGPTQPPVQWVPRVFYPGVKRGRGVMLITKPYLVPPPWRVAESLYLYLFALQFCCYFIPQKSMYTLVLLIKLPLYFVPHLEMKVAPLDPRPVTDRNMAQYIIHVYLVP
jgi:hypothetical protein